jgi:hypothetical protein
VGGQLDELAGGPHGHEQTAARVVQSDAIRPTGQIQPSPRLDAAAHGEDQQRVPARVGHPAPRRRCSAIQARDVRGTDASGRAAEDPSARVAQLERALAPEQDDAAPAGERSDLARRADRRRELIDARRSAAGQHRRRGTEEKGGGHRTAAACRDAVAERATPAAPHDSA